jgi:TatD DNase family protein
MSFVDSHCHLDFPELAADLPAKLDASRGVVTHALCIGRPARQPRARWHRPRDLPATVGTHPDYPDTVEPDVATLVELAGRPKVVAIGETGLDYYRLTGDLAWQRERFRTHIRAARESGKPLVVHTRSAADDTLAILREERAHEVGGVMHCFTETWDVAAAAMDLGFHISFRIVSFRNAVELQDVARRVPLERMLIETDSPYLAPVPHRGRRNHPALVVHVAEAIARLRGVDVGTGRASVTTPPFPDRPRCALTCDFRLPSSSSPWRCRSRRRGCCPTTFSRSRTTR